MSIHIAKDPQEIITNRNLEQIRKTSAKLMIESDTDVCIVCGKDITARKSFIPAAKRCVDCEETYQKSRNNKRW